MISIPMIQIWNGVDGSSGPLHELGTKRTRLRSASEIQHNLKPAFKIKLPLGGMRIISKQHFVMLKFETIVPIYPLNDENDICARRSPSDHVGFVQFLHWLEIRRIVVLRSNSILVCEYRYGSKHHLGRMSIFCWQLLVHS